MFYTFIFTCRHNLSTLGEYPMLIRRNQNYNMTIEPLNSNDLNVNLQEEIYNLYKQLNSRIKQLPLKQVLEESNNVIVILCKVNNNVVGIALLATYKVISGYRGMVEDVVVDASQRGKGIGRKLMNKLLEEGKRQGLDEILLFSGHHRTPAITLYKSLGFALRDSGLYSLKFS